MHALLSTEESSDALIASYWRKHRCTHYYLLKKVQMHTLLSTEESSDARIDTFYKVLHFSPFPIVMIVRRAIPQLSST